MSGRHRQRKDTASIDPEGFRRVHRLTPLLRFWSVILAFLTLLILNFNAEIVGDAIAYLQGEHWSQLGRGSLLTLLIFVALCLMVWFLSAVWWRKLGFKLGEEEISLRHGVISTTFRSARYDRIQAVDVVESVIARIFGLAAVRVETAGGVASVIEIRYLRKREAEALRREVLMHVHGAPREAVEEQAEDYLIEEVPVRRTLVAEALRLPTLTVLAVMAVLWFSPVAKASVVPFIVGFMPNIWGLIDTSWRFVARHDAEKGVLHISYGLADRRQQAIRLSRIHGVRVTQPFLWRPFGWYEVQVSVAGYGAKGGGKQSGSTRILPVGTREQAMAVFSLVSPLTREQAEEYARPEGHTHPTYVSPGRAWLASPVDLRRQSVTLLGEAAITHSGRIARRVCVIGTPHIQELTYKAGPVARLLRVGSVHFDLVSGPVRMGGRELEPAHARELLARLRARRLPELALDDAPFPR